MDEIDLDAPKASEAKARAVRENGKKGGRPEGSGLLTLDAEKLADACAERMLAGQSTQLIPRNCAPASTDDKRALQRIIGESADDFNARLSGKLMEAADRIADRILETVAEGRFKPGELGFIFSVVEDKRARLDGRAAIGAAGVNIQVNNFGRASRNDILDAIAAQDGET